MATQADIRRVITHTIPGFPGYVAPGGDNLGVIVGRGFVLVLALAGLAALGFFLWAGYGWLTAGDDPKKAEEARSKMTNAVIGLGIIAASLALGSVVNQFFQTGTSVQMDSGSGGTSSSGGEPPCIPTPGSVC